MGGFPGTGRMLSGVRSFRRGAGMKRMIGGQLDDV
jgi:hypothetical protein